MLVALIRINARTYFPYISVKYRTRYIPEIPGFLGIFWKSPDFYSAWQNLTLNGTSDQSTFYSPGRPTVRWTPINEAKNPV